MTTAPLTRRSRRASAPIESTTVRPDGEAAPIADSRIEAPALSTTTPSSTESPGQSTSMSDTITPEGLQTSETPFDLLEPEIEPRAEALSDAATTTFSAGSATDGSPDDADAAASVLDEFEKAARLFAFTGETAIQSPAGPQPTSSTKPSTGVAPAARAARAKGVRRAATASFSVGVMGLVGLLTVGMTTPAAAVAAATNAGSVASNVVLAGDVPRGSEAIQAYVAPAQVENVAIQRSGAFETGTLVDMAGVAGISNYSSSVFTNNPNCPIQWPFAVGVTMSYGFGMRDGTMHEGIDFTPGDGAHIQAIDEGVVRISTDSGGAYGVTIVIDHIVDGALLSSRYAHMQYGSRQVEVGDKVEVGEFIGRTGDTGRSYGAHTHFEILAGGTTAIDPLPWLQQHTTC
jgi:murein DD-endopeptidase MepM/ murein hydrolase activator NlpD